MCEIHVIYSLDGNLENEESHERVRMLSNGGVNNEDGYGVFNDQDTIFKRPIQYKRKFDGDLLRHIAVNKFIV